MESESMLSTLNKPINKSEIAYIEYSVEVGKNQSINPLNELLCDIINVFTPIEKRDPFNLKDKNEREIAIKNVPKKLLGKTTANNNLAFNHIGLVITN